MARKTAAIAGASATRTRSVVSGVDGAAWAVGDVEIRNPARFCELVGFVRDGSISDVDRAVEAAHGAYPGWAGCGAAKRAVQLMTIAASLESDVERIAHLSTREHGRLLALSVRDVRGAIAVLRYYAGLAEAWERPEIVDDERGRFVVARRPVGVGVAIVPWNSPLVLGALMIGPLLVAGNTVVLKVPAFAPLAAARVFETIAALLPPGVLAVVAGDGPNVGGRMTSHPLVRKVSFTGSTATGRAIMRNAADSLKNLTLELGGNDAAIVLESATIDEALVERLAGATFALTGQVCSAVKRIYVAESRYEAFVERYCAAVDRIVVGDGLSPDATMGPLNNGPQFARVTGLVEAARARGATVRTLGQKLDAATWSEGYFMLPSVILDAPPDAEVVTCEQFGPAVPILRFRSEDEAVAMANDSEYGLTASVWTDDVARGFEVAARLESGSAFVNGAGLGEADFTFPFGGVKQSGIGRSSGAIALDEASEIQTLVHRRR